MGGALFAGISLYVVLPLIVTLWPGAVRWVGLLPGGTGIGLGRNPNGAVHDMREGFAALAGSPSSLLVMTLAVLAVLRPAARRRDRQLDVRRLPRRDPAGRVDRGDALGRGRAADAGASSTASPRRRPLEWVGIDRPWNDDDVDALDRYLGTSESEWEPSGAARG